VLEEIGEFVEDHGARSLCAQRQDGRDGLLPTLEPEGCGCTAGLGENGTQLTERLAARPAKGMEVDAVGLCHEPLEHHRLPRATPPPHQSEGRRGYGGVRELPEARHLAVPADHFAHLDTFMD
jgi:hypothetical protein